MKDLRPISKTPVGGKIIEKRIMYELEMDTKETLNDPTQYGNAKGSTPESRTTKSEWLLMNFVNRYIS